MAIFDLCRRCHGIHPEEEMCAPRDYLPVLKTMYVLDDVMLERKRQEEKFPDQHLPDGTDNYWSGFRDSMRAVTDNHARAGTLTWLDVLREEVFEAFCETEPDKLYVELIQVAAVAARWAEDIHYRA